MTVTFVTDPQMRQYNRRALGHDWVTDVLTFRYDDRAQGSRLKARGSCLQPPASSLRPIIGEILIAPSQARAYAKTHGFSYEEELSRYVVHGLLHWKGHDDATPTQQRRMRVMEDQLLISCGVK